MRIFHEMKYNILRARRRVRGFLKRIGRLRLKLAFGVFANSLCIVWNLVLAALYRDALLLAVSVYYIFLALMRYALLRCELGASGEGAIGDVSVAVGKLLIVAGAAFGAVMIYTLAFEVKKNYSPVSIIPQSFFLLYCLVGAIIRIAWRNNRMSKTLLAADVIALAAAFFSVFNFVNYLSHMSFPIFDRSLTLAVGCVALLVIFFAAVYLIKSDSPRAK